MKIIEGLIPKNVKCKPNEVIFEILGGGELKDDGYGNLIGTKSCGKIDYKTRKYKVSLV
jgi:hypothetical protein